jgi:hypothetical protein
MRVLAKLLKREVISKEQVVADSKRILELVRMSMCSFNSSMPYEILKGRALADGMSESRFVKALELLNANCARAFRSGGDSVIFDRSQLFSCVGCSRKIVNENGMPICSLDRRSLQCVNPNLNCSRALFKGLVGVLGDA